MKDHANALITEEDFANAGERWSFDVPDTKEGYYIRQVFEGMFPSETAARTAVRWVTVVDSIVQYLIKVSSSWIPRGDWGCASDPSGRSVGIHESAYDGKA